MRGKWFTIAAVLALLVVAAVGLYSLRRAAAAKPQAQQTPPPAAYSGSDVTLSGRIRAADVRLVAAPIEGVIDSYHVEMGDEVYEGQLLAVVKSQGSDVEVQRVTGEVERAQNRVNNLESALIDARLEAARAGADATRARMDYERAEKTYARQKMLLEAGATPRLQFEKAEREYAAARTESEGLGTLARNAESRVEEIQKELDAARKLLDERNKDLEHAQTEAAAGEVHAPANGIVVGRRGQPGDEVDRSMQDLFQIATDTSRLQVTLEPAPPVLARIRAGQTAIVQVAENAGEAAAGQVTSVENNIVVVEFANPNPDVRPGLTAHVRIMLEGR